MSCGRKNAAQWAQLGLISSANSISEPMARTQIIEQEIRRGAYKKKFGKASQENDSEKGFGKSARAKASEKQLERSIRAGNSGEGFGRKLLAKGAASRSANKGGSGRFWRKV